MRIRIAAWLGSLAAASLVWGLEGRAAELRVAAAASLRPALEAALPAYESVPGHPRVRVSYGASSALAAQIRAGAPLDLLLSADARIAHALFEAGWTGAPVPLVRNRLVVLAGERAAFQDLEGLARVRRIAVPDHAVPVGRYAREWLRDRHLLEALRDRLIPTEHARATLVAVDRGLVDAAIVYATDARLARRARIAFEIPAAQQPEIVYAACLVKRDTESRFAASLLEHLTGGAARAHFAGAGFLVEAP